MSVQQSYNINPLVGFPGLIAEPNSPQRVERGVINIPSGAVTPIAAARRFGVLQHRRQRLAGA